MKIHLLSIILQQILTIKNIQRFLFETYNNYFSRAAAYYLKKEKLIWMLKEYIFLEKTCKIKYKDKESGSFYNTKNSYYFIYFFLDF